MTEEELKQFAYYVAKEFLYDVVLLDIQDAAYEDGLELTDEQAERVLLAVRQAKVEV